MKQVIILSALLISAHIFSYGQDTAVLKRTPYRLIVAVDKNSDYEEDINATAYVLPNMAVQIYPGETIYIEVEQDNGVIKSMTAVKANVNPAKTLVITFSQSVKKKVHEMMMLEIKNPFSQNLVYKANFFPLKGTRWVATDVLPVQAGLSAFETWPNIITSLALGNWAFEKK